MHDIATAVRQLISAEFYDPFEILGPHPMHGEDGPSVVIRSYEPGARELYVLELGAGRREQKMEGKYASHFFECRMTNGSGPLRYRLRAVYDGGGERTYHDPYAFRPELTD